MPEYTILVNADGEGDVWHRHPREFKAPNGDAAITQLRNGEPELKRNLSAQFFATAKFKPRKMRRQLVERWALDDVSVPDDEPKQGTLA